MKKFSGTNHDSNWNAGLGAALGVLFGSSAADLIAPGSSIIGLIGLFTGALIGAIIGHRYRIEKRRDNNDNL